jgi:hypothetical protein
MKGAEGGGSGLGLDARDRKVAVLDRRRRRARPRPGWEVELVELLAREGDEAGGELLAARRLSCASTVQYSWARKASISISRSTIRRRQTDWTRPADLAPGSLRQRTGRQVEAHEVVERAAGEVGVHERRVHLAGVPHGLGHGGLGDGVEGDAGHLGVLADRLAVAQRLGQVPGDRLALAVGVGGEDEVGVVLERVGDGLEVLARVGGHLPLHGEALSGSTEPSLAGRSRTWP